MSQELTTYTKEQQMFIAACEQAQNLQLTDNVAAAFGAVKVIKTLKEVLSDPFMKEYIMPLQNTTIGFLTDHTGRPKGNGQPTPVGYSVDEVRVCLIDALSHGLQPTGNQFNIIAGRMYPTKEGYTALLGKLGVKSQITPVVEPSTTQGFVNVKVRIDYSYKGVKNGTVLPVQVKADQYSSPDQVKGKAERRAKKWLFEYITNIDMGEGDADSSIETIDDQTARAQAKQATFDRVEAQKSAMRRKAAVAAQEVEPETGEVLDMPEE